MLTRVLGRLTRASLLPVVIMMVVLPTCKCSPPSTSPPKSTTHPRSTCTPEQAWSSNAKCVDVALESDLQWFQGYTIESGVPTREFCRSFFDWTGSARDNSCTNPNAYKKVACRSLGIRDSASCFVCGGRNEDDHHYHLRAFPRDCSLGLSINAVNIELNQSMCDVTTSPLCNAPKKTKKDDLE